jgi:DNA-binding CsgD family transcriptional regulator
MILKMLDRMPQRPQVSNDRSREDTEPDLLGSFVIDEKYFKIILVNNKCDLADEPQSDIHEVIRFKLRGRTLAIVEEVRAPEVDGETRNMIARLTGRELQIAAMIAQGDATKNVAYKLRISEWTVGTHLRRIFAKLGVDNRAAMVYRCASLIENAPKSPARTQRTTASVD